MVFGFALQGICAGWSSSRIERGRGNNPYNMTSWVEYLPSGLVGGCCFCFICQKLHMRTSTFCMFSFNLKHFLSLNYKIHMQTNIPYIYTICLCVCASVMYVGSSLRAAWLPGWRHVLGLSFIGPNVAAAFSPFASCPRLQLSAKPFWATWSGCQKKKR